MILSVLIVFFMVRNDDFYLNVSKGDLHEKGLYFKVLFMYFKAWLIYEMVFKLLVTSCQWASY